MKSKVLLVALGAIALVLVVGLRAEAQLPKSGTVKLHSGWKGVGDIREVGKDHLYWEGTFYGMWFNDENRGFLHLTHWVCAGITDIKDGRQNLNAFCTATDRDGDQITTLAKGRGAEGGFDDVGMHSLTGGSGKYAGIEGTITWRCYATAKHAQFSCWHDGNYRLPS